MCCAKVLTWLGPKGLEPGRYSTGYHDIRNYIYVIRHMGAEPAARHVPEFARRLVAMANQKGEIDARCAKRCIPREKPTYLEQIHGNACHMRALNFKAQHCWTITGWAMQMPGKQASACHAEHLYT